MPGAVAPSWSCAGGTGVAPLPPPPPALSASLGRTCVDTGPRTSSQIAPATALSAGDRRTPPPPPRESHPWQVHTADQLQCRQMQNMQLQQQAEFQKLPQKPLPPRRTSWTCGLHIVPRSAVVAATKSCADAAELEPCIPSSSSRALTGPAAPFARAPPHLRLSIAEEDFLFAQASQGAAAPTSHILPASSATAGGISGLRALGETVCNDESVLRILSLPPLPSAPGEAEVGCPVAAIQIQSGGSGNTGARNVCFTCPPGTPVLAAEDGFLFPAPPDLIQTAAAPSGVDTLALLVLRDDDAPHEVAAQLLTHGCMLRWQASSEAAFMAESVQNAGRGLAGVIRHAGEVLGRGVRTLGADGAQLLTPEPVEMPEEALEAAQTLRQVTKVAASATSTVVEGIATVVGMGVGAVAQSLPDGTQQWQADFKVVGKTSLGVGAEVWASLYDASAHFWRDVAETSSDVMGHKYGPDARVATRNSLHAVGNAMEAASFVSTKSGPAILAGKSAQATADVIDSDAAHARPACPMAEDHQLHVAAQPPRKMLTHSTTKGSYEQSRTAAYY